MIRLLCIAFICSIVSCQPKHKTVAIENSCFDLTQYFQSEAALLTSQKYIMEKRASINDSVDYLKSNNPDWEKEFSFLIQSSLSCENWSNYYSVDSINTDTIQSLVYTAIDAKRKIRKTRIGFNKNIPVIIEINLAEENQIFKSHTTLIYEPRKKITILSIQKSSVQSEKRIEIITEIQNIL